MSTHEIQFRLQDCETLQELTVCWDYIKGSITNENKSHLIEVKEVMKEYLTNRIESEFEDVNFNVWWEGVLKLPKSEKQKIFGFNIKKLKYYGAI